ncbi:MAG: hypothetical protein ACI8UO_004201 [Verrucomicrobiales bacterium]|jgi:uncharacterized protein (TIGR02646 family)
MRKFDRLPAPEFLNEKWEDWGKAWEAKKAEKPGAAFNWRQVDKTPVNQKLLPLLMEQTQAHCSFCDGYPVSPPGKDTIEHFRPKSKFHREAWHWPNLYYCCSFCQDQKLDKYDEGLLRPDADDFDFDRYFLWDYTTGEIKVNEKATSADQQRAAVTIELFGLNQKHPKFRQRETRRRSREQAEPIDDFAYRNYLEPS